MSYQERVAANPESDIQALLMAASYYPNLVAQNPALSLELVINPQFALSLGSRELADIVAFEGAPRPLLDLALKRVQAAPNEHASIAKAFLMHRALEPQHVTLAARVVKKGFDPSETTVYHRAFYRDQKLVSPSEAVERFLCRLLMADLDESIAESHLVNSFVPRAYLRHRIGGIDGAAKWVAEAPITAPEVLAYMGQVKEFAMLRDKLAEHPNAPSSMLEAFMSDPWVMQEKLLHHPNLPEGVRRELVATGEPWQVKLMASNPNLTCSEQMQIVASGQRKALWVLVRNRSLCPRVATYIAALLNRTDFSGGWIA